MEGKLGRSGPECVLGGPGSLLGTLAASAFTALERKLVGDTGGASWLVLLASTPHKGYHLTPR